MTVAEKIKKDIRDKGLTHYAVADKAEISRQIFSKILNGRREFDVKYLLPICKALGEKPSKYID